MGDFVPALGPFEDFGDFELLDDLPLPPIMEGSLVGGSDGMAEGWAEAVGLREAMADGVELGDDETGEGLVLGKDEKSPEGNADGTKLG